MKMLERKDWPILLVNNSVGAKTTEGWELEAIVNRLEKRLGCTVYNSVTCEDALDIIKTHADIACVVVDWSLGLDTAARPTPLELIRIIRNRNSQIPIMIMSGKQFKKRIPLEALEVIDGYIWILEDTVDFIAGRIETELQKYIDSIPPLFFKELVKYAEEYKFAWHTPGHMGGVAFLKTPAGIACHKFFGENVFRADLSVSVPELGSLLDHEGVVGDAEKEAARVFGADYTYFVLNGSSSSNQIIWHARVTDDDITLMDRNCHKSLNYAMIVTGATPMYMIPSRNAYGTIGPIHVKEFEPATIRRKIKNHPLIKDKNKKVKMSVITNSTYDGLCYNVVRIKEKLSGMVDNLHFDEAWYGYAKFHPLYKKHFGMSPEGEKPDHPPVFATQSTHKLLAAWSQASMIHVKNGGEEKINPALFNEAYMIQGSTSPMYGMIATLDVATRMMKGNIGRQLMNDTIEEPIVFRQKMVQIGLDIKKSEKDKKKQWWFTAWQPDKVTVKEKGKTKVVPFEKVSVDYLMNNQDCWTLKPNQKWHLFGEMERDYIMLDPIKVTIATPGIDKEGNLDNWGIPASIVTSYLMTKGVVVEKTGHYSWLLLFSIGVTKGKTGTLMAEMFNFKKLYDNNVPLEQVLPDLVREHPEAYTGWTIQDLCLRMHAYIKKHKIVSTMLKCFEFLPDPVMIPAAAYKELVLGNVESVFLDDMMGRIPAVMVVPYPPGIPIIMPGEMFNKKSKLIIDYLKKVQEFEFVFPGFTSDIHGVEREADENGKELFKIYCLTKK